MSALFGEIGGLTESWRATRPAVNDVCAVSTRWARTVVGRTAASNTPPTDRVARMRRAEWRECMGIEPTQPDIVRSRTVLKTVEATRLHPLPSATSVDPAAGPITRARVRSVAAASLRQSPRIPARAKDTPTLGPQARRRAIRRTSVGRRGARAPPGWSRPSRRDFPDTPHSARRRWCARPRPTLHARPAAPARDRREYAG